MEAKWSKNHTTKYSNCNELSLSDWSVHVYFGNKQKKFLKTSTNVSLWTSNFPHLNLIHWQIKPMSCWSFCTWSTKRCRFWTGQRAEGSVTYRFYSWRRWGFPVSGIRSGSPRKHSPRCSCSDRAFWPRAGTAARKAHLYCYWKTESRYKRFVLFILFFFQLDKKSGQKI